MIPWSSSLSLCARAGEERRDPQTGPGQVRGGRGDPSSSHRHGNDQVAAEAAGRSSQVQASRVGGLTALVVNWLTGQF